jgi:hypothetical protein
MLKDGSFNYTFLAVSFYSYSQSYLTLNQWPVLYKKQWLVAYTCFCWQLTTVGTTHFPILYLIIIK